MTTDLKPNERVGIHPMSDWFMRGCRYGVVQKIGHKYIHVRLDRLPKRTIRFHPDHLLKVN